MQRFFSLGGLGQAGRRDQQQPRSFFIDRFNPQRRTGIAIRLQRFGFHAQVAKLFESPDQKVETGTFFSRRGGGDQAVDKVNLRSLIGVQSVQVDFTLLISTQGLPTAKGISARTHSLSGGFADFGERHPCSLIAGEGPLE